MPICNTFSPDELRFECIEQLNHYGPLSIIGWISNYPEPALRCALACTMLDYWNERCRLLDEDLVYCSSNGACQLLYPNVQSFLEQYASEVVITHAKNKLITAQTNIIMNMNLINCTIGNVVEKGGVGGTQVVVQDSTQDTLNNLDELIARAREAAESVAANVKQDNAIVEAPAETEEESVSRPNFAYLVRAGQTALEIEQTLERIARKCAGKNGKALVCELVALENEARIDLTDAKPKEIYTELCRCWGLPYISLKAIREACQKMG